MSERASQTSESSADGASDADEVDVGLRVAFGGERLSGPGGHDVQPEASILRRLAESGRAVNRVVLRDAETGVAAATERVAEGPRSGGTLGRYRVIGEIARGGMGLVLRGHDVDLGRDVAMKVLLDEHVGNPELLQRFVEEAQIGGQLQHPGIVPVFEMGMREDRRPFFTMKWIKGKTLAELLADRADVEDDRRRLLQVLEYVCQTMAYAHARGVIHRDLKPSNVMVGAFGEVHVVDWGLGRVLRHGGVADERRLKKAAEVSIVATIRSKGAGSESLVGSVMGTPRYMPPEQARGDVDAMDERSDVFALGAILCEILTGEPPYAGEDASVLLRAAKADLADAYARLDACGADASLVAVARSCLAPAPQARPRDAGVVAREVSAHAAAAEERSRSAEAEAAEAEAAAAEARTAAEAQETAARATRADAERSAAVAARERRARRLALALSVAAVVIVVLGAGGWWFFSLRAAARGREATNSVARALADAALLEGTAAGGTDVAAWKEALSAVRRAEALAAAADASVRRRVADARSRVESSLEKVEAAEANRVADAKAVELLEVARRRLFFDSPGLTDGRMREAFRIAGVDVDALPHDEAVKRLSGSAIEGALGPALDEWVWVRGRGRADLSLLSLAQDADPDPWRRRVRVARSWIALLELAREAGASERSARDTLLLALHLAQRGAERTAFDYISLACARHPDDLWLNDRAIHLCRQLVAALAAAHALPRAASVVALAPRSAEGWFALARFLHALGPEAGPDAAASETIDFAAGLSSDPGEFRFEAALWKMTGANWPAEVLATRQALASRPTGIRWRQFAEALSNHGDQAAAIAAYEEAAGLGDRDSFERVARARLRAGEIEAEVLSSRAAAGARPDDPDAAVRLAYALNAVGDWDGLLGAFADAVRRATKAVERDAESPLPRLQLANALLRCGRFRESADALHEAACRSEDRRFALVWRDVSIRERTAEMAASEPAADANVDAGQAEDWGYQAKAARLHLHAYAWFERAEAARVQTASVVGSERIPETNLWRPFATCAVQLALGASLDGVGMTAAERSTWLDRAHARLRSSLDAVRSDVAWGRLVYQSSAASVWKGLVSDPELAGVREPDRLARLDAATRSRWEALWTDTRALIARLEAK